MHIPPLIIHTHIMPVSCFVVVGLTNAEIPQTLSPACAFWGDPSNASKARTLQPLPRDPAPPTKVSASPCPTTATSKFPCRSSASRASCSGSYTLQRMHVQNVRCHTQPSAACKGSNPPKITIHILQQAGQSSQSSQPNRLPCSLICIKDSRRPSSSLYSTVESAGVRNRRSIPSA